MISILCHFRWSLPIPEQYAFQYSDYNCYITEEVRQLIIVILCYRGGGGGGGSLLRSRYQGRHATLLPTNGCSRERHIPFPLFLRTNRMHVIVIGYANLASCKQPNKILLQRDLFLPVYSRRSDLRRIFLPVVSVRFDP